MSDDEGSKGESAARGVGCTLGKKTYEFVALNDSPFLPYEGPQPPIGEMLLAVTPTPMATRWEIKPL